MPEAVMLLALLIQTGAAAAFLLWLYVYWRFR